MYEPEPGDFRIRPATMSDDRLWLSTLWLHEWGDEIVVSRGRVHRMKDVEALIAFEAGARAGAATYRIEGVGCELISLNAVVPRVGLGTRLLQAVEENAALAACTGVWLIRTNDNLAALRFYQRRGYNLSRFFPGAIHESRRIKPGISIIGNYGIEIRDEIELEKPLG